MGFGEREHSEFPDEGVAQELEIVGSHLFEGEDPAATVHHFGRTLRPEHALAGGERDVKDHVFGEGREARDGKPCTSHGQLQSAPHGRTAVRFDEPVVVEKEPGPPSPPTTIEPR